MSKLLNDGTVIPSVLSIKQNNTAHQMAKNNYSLKVGIVTDIFYSDDTRNFTKKAIEYNVAVIEDNNKNGSSIMIYRNCIVNNTFGSGNNYLDYTLTAIGQNNILSQNFQNSLVLLLCINGNTDAGSAVIIGAINSPNGPKYVASDGQFYNFSFNGINYNINNDGEWTLTFNSPYDENGKETNSAAAGTQIKIDKDGRIKISDNDGQYWELDRIAQTSTWSNGNDSIIIDKDNKVINLTSSGTMDSSSQKAMGLTSQDAVNISSKSDMTVDSQANLVVKAQNNMSQTVNGSWNLNISGNINATIGGNVTMNAGGNVMINGTTVALANGAIPVALLGSMSIGRGNLGAPVISQVFSQTATKVFGE